MNNFEEGKRRKNSSREEREMTDSDTNVLDVESEEGEQISTKDARKLDEDKKIWGAGKGGWTMDPNVRHAYGPKLNLDQFEILDELDYFMHFLPMRYIEETILPATTKYAHRFVKNFEPLTMKDFLRYIGIYYSMEVVKLPEHHMYSSDEVNGIFPKVF